MEDFKLKEKTLKNQRVSERLPKKVLNVCQKFGVDEENIDFESEFQNVSDTLDKYSEIVHLIAEHSSLDPANKEMVKAELLKENIKKAEQLKEEISENENKEIIEAQEDILLEEFKSVDDKKLLNSPSFYQMKERINMVVKGFYDVAFITSKGGFSKTYTGFQLTKGIDTAYISCKATPLELYKMLYQNKDKEIIILDDLKWDSDHIVSLLKGAWQSVGTSKKRIVQYNSSKLTIPKVFDISARFICFANKIPKSTDMSALISRTLYYEFEPNYKEKLHLIEQVSKKSYKEMNAEQRKKVFDFIKKNTSPATEGLNLRTYFKLCDFYRYDTYKWETLAFEEIKEDPRTALIYQLNKSGKPVKEQIEEFCAKTNESRRTFFRIKGKL